MSSVANVAPLSSQGATEVVRAEFNRRMQRNPSYSLRAFARHLGLSSGRLSELLGGKRVMTEDQARRIAAVLFRSEADRRRFVDAAATEARQGRDVRLLPRGTDLNPPKTARVLAEDEFAQVAEWQHFAVLNLLDAPACDGTAAWIAERLALPEETMAKTLATLERLGLVTATEGRHVRAALRVSSTHNVPSAAVREGHRQRMQKAIDALDKLDVVDRDMTGIALRMRPENMPTAKKYIQEFRRKVGTLLADQGASDVYFLNIQLFPVTKSKKS